MKLLVVTVLIGLTTFAPTAYGDVLNLNKEFLDGYNNFTSDLYKVIAEHTPQNFLVSPISIDMILSLTEYGLISNTSQQLKKVLYLPENKEQIREAFTTLMPILTTNDKNNLLNANKVYVKEGIAPLEDLENFVQTVYNTPIESINFEAEEDARNKINRWVEDNTRGNIKHLVGKEQFGPDTRSFFLNALYFRGNWINKFNPSETKADVFHLGNRRKIDVPLMEITDEFKFYDSPAVGARILELPYEGEDITLTIVLPNVYNGLKTLENEIHEVLTTNRLKRTPVHVRLPKFQVEFKIDFNDYLVKLGVIDAFDKAQFPKITLEKLQINKVFQKVRIEVNEGGTSSSEDSAVTLSDDVRLHRQEFIANHPFIFILKYKCVVLCIGHYTGKEE